MKEILIANNWLCVQEESNNYFIVQSIIDGKPIAVPKDRALDVRVHAPLEQNWDDWEDVTENCYVKQDQLFHHNAIVATVFPPYRLRKKAFPSGYENVNPEAFSVMRWKA